MAPSPRLRIEAGYEQPDSPRVSAVQSPTVPVVFVELRDPVRSDPRTTTKATCVIPALRVVGRLPLTRASQHLQGV